MSKIAIGIPSGDTMPTDTALNLIDIMGALSNSGIPADLLNIRSSRIHESRNLITQKTLDEGSFTHIMWIDSDVVMNPYTPARLLKAGLNIIGCTYRKRYPPYNYTHTEIDGADTTVPLRRVHGMPGGCVLVNLDVYRTIGKGWYDEFGGHGEDFAFCQRAREAGYDIWLDVAASLQVKHVGMCAFGADYVK